ncbi:Hypothetical protein PHPALM_537 [Phytophthora palmivora]|uniref:Uncharacterized protein n=1 Tax=Phytophthora palmivora TaxID=4796 RepID=A0A2P4YUJ6_9STRA|nr:Hypothetical protein PHPALM_537 [Phytophthora palmivora]
MNFREYPVLVVEVSDRSRVFHVVALFIVSQETQFVLKRLFLITGRELQVQFAVRDADKAKHNALSAVFGG